MRILFLSAWQPFPPDNGAKLRAYHLLQALGAAHAVTLLAFVREGEPLPRAGEGCARARGIPWIDYRPETWRARAALLAPAPRSVAATWSRAMRDAVREEAAREPFDLVIASELWTARYAAGAAPRALLESVEVGIIADAARDAAGWRGWRARLTWAKLRRYLHRVAARFDLLTVVSEVERALVGAAGVPAARVRVVPNGVDAARLGEVAPDPEPGVMIYPGALGYAANADAVGFFCREVLPRVRAAEPRARLVVTGRADGPARAALAGTPGVAFTGHVPDIRGPLARSQLCVVPVRIGGGTRLKILEAMAAGVPVLSTRKGAEGLDVVPGAHLLVADTPDELAAAALRLLADAPLRRALADRARALVRARYDWAAIGAAFRELVAAVAAGRLPARAEAPGAARPSRSTPPARR